MVALTLTLLVTLATLVYTLAHCAALAINAHVDARSVRLAALDTRAAKRLAAESDARYAGTHAPYEQRTFFVARPSTEFRLYV